ncbi:MAG: hypothetical protein ACLFVJ_19160 [Persicimonas sp.]
MACIGVVLVMSLWRPAPAGADEPPEAQEAPVEVGDPIVFTAPTGRIIPSGVIYPRAGFDTSESFIGGARVGLGGFAEAGIVSTPFVRFERPGEGRARYFNGYPLVVARIGANEGHLWSDQPGLAIGLRKSFTVHHLGRETHLSELTVAFTKSLGPRVSLTLGAAKWDGEIALEARGPDGTWALDEERDWGERIRPFAGIEVSPQERFRLMLEGYYMPEFELEDAPNTPGIELDAAVSLGLRSELASWLILDVGARGPDLDNLHQIDAELFGQVIVPLRFLHGWMD